MRARAVVARDEGLPRLGDAGQGANRARVLAGAGRATGTDEDEVAAGDDVRVLRQALAASRASSAGAWVIAGVDLAAPERLEQSRCSARPRRARRGRCRWRSGAAAHRRSRTRPAAARRRCAMAYRPACAAGHGRTRRRAVRTRGRSRPSADSWRASYGACSRPIAGGTWLARMRSSRAAAPGQACMKPFRICISPPEARRLRRNTLARTILAKRAATAIRRPRGQRPAPRFPERHWASPASGRGWPNPAFLL